MVLGSLLLYNLAIEFMGEQARSLRAQPAWAIAVFGWIACVLCPFAMLPAGLLRPWPGMRSCRSWIDGDAAGGSDGFAAGGGGGGGLAATDELARGRGGDGGEEEASAKPGKAEIEMSAL